MLLTRYDPVAAEFDRLVERTFGSAATGRPAMRMDGIRRENGVELRFDLPGIDPQTIEVTVDQDVLTVSASRSDEYAEAEKPFIRERAMGSFARRVRLSDAVDAEQIEASYDRGVLTVHALLAEKALPRKVEVRTSAQAEIEA